MTFVNAVQGPNQPLLSLRHLGIIREMAITDSTEPFNAETFPSLISLAIGRPGIQSQSALDIRPTVLDASAYVEATARLFKPLCQQLRHLAFDGDQENLNAWVPLLKSCTSLIKLHVYSARQAMIPVLCTLDVPTILTLHLDAARKYPFVGTDVTSDRRFMYPFGQALIEGLRAGRF